MRVWVTRAQPGADATAERLRARGHDPLVMPLLAVRPLQRAAIDLAGVGAVALTSANAATLLAGLTSERRLPVFVVGNATAQAARASGFTDVWSADGDVEALARLIVEAWPPGRGAILQAGAREPAGDLAGALAAAGIAVRGVDLYDTQAAEPGELDLAALDGVEAVLVHSPKAGRALARVAAAAPGLAQATVFALSKACAEGPLQAGFAELRVARAPKEEALLALLPDAPAEPEPAPKPNAAERPRRVGWTFWAALLFGLLCVVGGAIIGVWGSRIFPP